MVRGYEGVLCLACRAQSNFDTDAENMAVWVYIDRPECSLIQFHCKWCRRDCNIYLGEEWQQDAEYLIEIGLGYIVVDEAPSSVVSSYHAAFGFWPLTTTQQKEIAFFAHLLGNQYDEWWSEIETP